MKFYTLELNDKTIKMRLTSNDCMEIEEKYKVSILDFIKNMSITTIVTLLRYMVGSFIPNFSKKNATELYDELVDSGYVIETIINDIILEVMVVSGFMTKEDMEKMKAKETSEEEKIAVI